MKTLKPMLTILTILLLLNGCQKEITEPDTEENPDDGGIGVTEQAAAPTFSPAAGNYTNAISITITSLTADAAIYYTTDGTTPSAAATLYSAPVEIIASLTLKAISIKTGYKESTITSGDYVINYPDLEDAATPQISPAGATFTNVQTVTISSTTPSANIYYTTNGSIPTASSLPYTGAFQIADSVTVKAIAVATGYDNSAVAMEDFTLLEAPLFSLPNGTSRMSNIALSLSCNTFGASVYYTTNGTEPSVATSLYTAPLAINDTVTIKTVAILNGVTSPVSSATYTIEHKLIVYESFNYPANTVGSGCNTSSGGPGAPYPTGKGLRFSWTVNTKATNYNLSYMSLATSNIALAVTNNVIFTGPKIYSNELVSDPFASYREANMILGKDNSTFYFSFLMQSHFIYKKAFLRLSDINGKSLDIGLVDNSSYYRLKLSAAASGLTISTNVAVQGIANTPVFFTGRIKYGNQGNVTADFWINRDPAAGEPQTTPDLQYINTDNDPSSGPTLKLFQIGGYNENTTNRFIIDEIRFGTTWKAVTPLN